MGKPAFKVYENFARNFKQIDEQLGKNQFVLPYFITGHPGCSLQDAVKLAEYIRDMGFFPEQVQDFYPTPGSVATAMYHTGVNPLTMEAVYVPKGREKNMQRALVQYNKRENYLLVHEALTKAYREDLIGSGKKALIPAKLKSSDHPTGQGGQAQKNKKNSKTRSAQPASAKRSKNKPKR